MSSDFLFVRPSAFRGFARTLDLVGSLNSYNWSGSANEADARAMFADWASVGDELAGAIDSFASHPVDSAGNEQLRLIDAKSIE